MISYPDVCFLPFLFSTPEEMHRQQDLQYESFVNSPLVSASVGNTSVTFTKSNVTLTFKTRLSAAEFNLTNYQCAYWDEATKGVSVRKKYPSLYNIISLNSRDLLFGKDWNIPNCFKLFYFIANLLKFVLGTCVTIHKSELIQIFRTVHNFAHCWHKCHE